MLAAAPRRKIHRQLRFRLTASYVLFFTCAYAVAGLALHQVLQSDQETESHLILDGLWSDLLKYLRFGSSGPVWRFKQDNPDQISTVTRVRNVLMVADEQGQVLEISAEYRLLEAETPAEIRRIAAMQKPVWRIRQSLHGVPYIVRAEVLSDASGRKYFVAIGRSLAIAHAIMDSFTRGYFTHLPLILAVGGIFGWFLTGHVLRPLNELVAATQRITGTNLGLRIPSRAAGDELDRLTETFNQMMDRLEDSFRQVKQFSTDVSHELRTPITAVRGQLEVALFTAKTQEQYRDAIQNALEETEHLSRLVQGMLLLSQAESGQTVLQKESHNVAETARNLVEQFQVAADEAGVKLTADLPAQCEAEVDQIQLERLLSNLITNALKFTPAGGDVRVSLEQGPESIELAVEDTGRGIAPEHVARIFDRFYRVPDPDVATKRGLGLGLNFVAWIAKAHGGKAAVESTLGKGSRFVITLPLKAVSAPAAGLELAAQRIENG